MNKVQELARRLGGRRGAVVVAVLVAVIAAIEAGVVLAGAAPNGITVRVNGPVPRAPVAAPALGGHVTVGHSYKNDATRPLRTMPRTAAVALPSEASPNPRPVSTHVDAPDAVRQTRQFAPSMPATTRNFEGIDFPGVFCNCYPPDTNGEVGATQYVQSVNIGFQVFDKTTGASLLGPFDIAAVWSGFGGVCETDGFGDPIVLYDQLANRWLITQFAGSSGVATDECVAVSQTSDATGVYYRYGFHLGSNFFDYPHLGVWPDAYYMSMNVFDSGGTSFLGPQPFAFNRAAMLAGAPASFITTGSTLGSSHDPILPADLDGSIQPPAGAPNPFVTTGPGASWPLYRFHVDWASPGSSTFTLGGTLTPAAFSELCGSTRSCVPQPGTAVGLDGIGDRGMFRSAYRRFADGHEALVGNMSVLSGVVAGIRWFEINHATSGAPAFTQQSTYQPDTTWRWMGSAAMDRNGDLALGFSVSSATTSPGIAYAGRLATDPASTLAQGEATLIAGSGSQTGTANRWGDYSDMTVDPVDDCTFWYTNEYYSTIAAIDWKTRIGSFKFPSCKPVWSLRTAKAGSGSGTVTSSPAGISCGGTCSAGFVDGTSVALTATPAAGSSFTGWSGACSGTGACVVPMTASKSVTATFTLQPRTLAVGLAGNGAGRVTSSPAGISCPSTCSFSYLFGTSVTLTATPSSRSVFGGWSGPCGGNGPCVLPLTVNTTATATFKAKCVVPKLVGLTLKKAKAKIRKAHCAVGKVTRKHSSARKKGRVLTQKPKPRRLLKPGAKVSLTVGKG